MAAGVLGSIWAAPAAAVDVQTAWRYDADSSAGAGPRHVARIEQDGHVLAYGCDSRSGRHFTIDISGPMGLPAPRRDGVALTFVFSRAGEPGRARRIEVVARAAERASGVVVEEPGANAVLLALIDGGHDQLTIEGTGLARSFSLAGAEAVVRRANTACSTSLPPQPVARDVTWDRFAYGGLFEIDMPDGAEEIATTIPMEGRVVRYGGIRGSDGHATYTAIVTDSGRRTATAAEQRRYVADFIAGTLEAMRRNGATVGDAPVPGGDGLAHDLRVEHANGATQSMRILLVGSRLYVLTATYRAGALSIARKDRFLASFRPL
jgi:hypothetical protein